MAVIISSLLIPQGFCQEAEDSQVFISGFNAYQQKNYADTIEKMNEVLTKFPETPLRDMALFWLSRAYFKQGNLHDAGRVMSQFSKEFPDNPLRSTAEEELVKLAASYARGERLPTASVAAKAAEERAAANAKAEEERLAKQQAEQQRIASARKEQEQLVTRKAEEERVANEKAEQDKLTASKSEQERLADRKAEEERAVRERAEQEKLASAKAQEERLAAEKAEQERLAAARAEEERLADVRAEQERLNAQRAELERKATEQVTLELVPTARAEQERLTQKKADQERQAQASLAKESEVRKAEEERLKQNQERIARDKAAADAEAARLSSAKKVQEQQAADKGLTEKASLREKAIAEYKSIIEKYPGSNAAAAAAEKLKGLGVSVALPPPGRLPAAERRPDQPYETAQVLKLQVAQFAGLEFNLLAPPQAYDVARRVSIPFEIINRGNGRDSFQLELGFPADFNASFTSTSSTGQPINQTPVLPPGGAFRGIINLTRPSSNIDGLRITHPVKAVSRFMPEATRSREVSFRAAAPLLRAVLRTVKAQPLPGEKISYRISMLNVGSTAAQNVTLRLNVPPQFVPIGYVESGFRMDNNQLRKEGININSGENKEYMLNFQIKDDALAGEELLLRAELVNNPLKISTAFVSAPSYVKTQRGVTVRSDLIKVVAIPGQNVAIPLVVTNTGNIREKFRMVSIVKGAQDALIYLDRNRDGVRQANEPLITAVGPLSPKEEASIVIEIRTPRSATDASEGNYQLAVSSEGDAGKISTFSSRLVYSRPVLQLAMVGREDRPKPGDIASFDLTVTNRGTGIAHVVELQSTWPELLELVASDPAIASSTAGNILWKFRELGAGEKRLIKVSFRVKQGTSVGTSIQVRNVMRYEDQLGNRY